MLNNSDTFKNHSYNPSYGILFISNHSSNMDGNLIYWGLTQFGYFISVWAHDFVFRLPYIGWAISSIDHVKVPNVPAKRDPRHRRRVHKALHRTADGLRQGKHFLLFPSGSSKKTPHEVIRGKSAVRAILRQIPGVNIVLVRHRGMWGSRFSWVTKQNPKWKSHASRLYALLWDWVKILTLNLVIFMPRRRFEMELVPAPESFPRNGSRKEINAWLEAYFNEGIPEEGEPVISVSEYFWKEKYLQYECLVKEYSYDTSKVPDIIQEEIRQIVARRSGILPEQVKEEWHLAQDVCLDSLELIALLIEIEKRFGLSPIIPGHISTVGHLMALASQIPVEAKMREIPIKVVRQSKAGSVAKGYEEIAEDLAA
ncbi:MAG: 1-acyl-sn-glycerol-3-phosphate acyltransferase [Parachlamydia sp.]|nr:1-acyl-sn-glycerol-3-phosphate acyltransferase [Parachlamydia sp.]